MVCFSLIEIHNVEFIFTAEIDLPARVARSSCRKNRLMVPMSKSSFNRAVHKIGYHPYKLVTKFV